ncbi:MAG: hypothetical protein COA88_06890 [Kordia sp.]|nr:MAG: hypothetical protein COA88_06890 [Kordia sp.]
MLNNKGITFKNIYMKQIFKYIAIAAISCSVFTSCNEDDNTGDSLINYSPVTVTLTSSENDVVLNETAIDADNGYAITVTATIDSPLPIDIIIPLTKISGTATGEDFTAGSITIPSSLTSASVTVIIHQTGNAEGDETLTIGAIDSSMIPNVSSVNAFALNVEINDDYIDYSFSMNFAWDGYVHEADEDGDHGFLPFCDMDIDFYFIVGGADSGIYDAATGSCPEELVIDSSIYADGTYMIYADLWANPYSAAGYDVSVPLTITYSHGYEGSFIPETIASPIFEYNTNDGTGAGAMVMEFEILSGVVTSVTLL